MQLRLGATVREGPGLKYCVLWHLTSCVARGKNNVNCNRMSGNETENKNKISHCLQKQLDENKTNTNVSPSTHSFTSDLVYHYAYLTLLHRTFESGTKKCEGMMFQVWSKIVSQRWNICICYISSSCFWRQWLILFLFSVTLSLILLLVFPTSNTWRQMPKHTIHKARALSHCGPQTQLHLE